MIHMVTGDATEPAVDGNKVIAHVCNDAGYWGKGFVLAISDKWPQVREGYLQDTKILGTAHFYRVLEDVDGDWYIGNMIAQKGIFTPYNIKPLQLADLKTCLALVNHFATKISATVHMPKIGSGLANEPWKNVTKVISAVDWGVDVYIYTLS